MYKPIIEVKTSDGLRRMLLTGEEPVTIGRDSTNSLAFRDKTLSPFHCVIERVGTSFQVRDLNSAAGTILNDQYIKREMLKSGDRVQAGRVKIKFIMAKTGDRSQRRHDSGGASGSISGAASDKALHEHDNHLVVTEAELVTGDTVRRKPQIPYQSTATSKDDLSGFINAKDLTEAAPVDDMEQTVASALEHEQTLRQMTRSLGDSRLGPSQIGLVNSQGQLVHGPIDEDVRTAVRGGREGVLFLRAFLLLCMQIRASDLHVEPKNDQFQVRVRVDGMMVPVLDMHNTIGRRLLRLVKVLCNIDIAQSKIVQDGHFCVQVPDRVIDYRVSFTPVMHGQKLVIRVLDQASAPSHLRELGLPPWMARDLDRIVHQDSGMVLMCGPTGSGKTTTLYALIREIDASVRNIITIEDPVEYQIAGVTQIPINESHNASFSTTLRSILRQDPDVILVGEIRDAETAKIAMQASITGHLVFSTVHAQDGIGAIFRLLDLGVEPYLIASSLNLVLAQRLVRKLCPSCKKSQRVRPAQAVRLAKFAVENLNVVKIPIGCPSCLKTGYIGRLAIFELLTATDDLKDVILAKTQIQEMRKSARAALFASLGESGHRLVADGLTSLEEIDRVVGSK